MHSKSIRKIKFGILTRQKNTLINLILFAKKIKKFGAIGPIYEHEKKKYKKKIIVVKKLVSAAMLIDTGIFKKIKGYDENFYEEAFQDIEGNYIVPDFDPSTYEDIMEYYVYDYLTYEDFSDMLGISDGVIYNKFVR